jgi:hypothetical protein
VFKNRFLRRVFEPKIYKVRGEWRKMHNEELYNLSPNIIRHIKTRGMRWAEHVTRMGEERKVYKFLVEGPYGH